MLKKLLTTFLMLPILSFGQLQDKQVPTSSSLQAISKSIPIISIKKPNVDSLEKAETKNSDPRPWKFGEIAKVNILPENSGIWTKVAKGNLWQLNIESADALTLNFIFNKFRLPAGGKFFIYNRLDTLGAFTDKNNQKDGKFATTLLRGSKVTLEYFEPEEPEFKAEIVLSEVIHGFRDVFKMAKAFGSSGSCHNNANCAVGSDWVDQKKAVVMLVVGGSGFCTGTVINNTAQNRKPYVLTANHCYSGDEATWVFWFNWESATCTNPSSSPSFSSLSGSVLKARNAQTDFCLVEINSAVPSTYNSYYVGWSRSSTGSPTGAAIHHPRGDIKKISFYNSPLTYDGWAGSSNDHWRANWSSGVTDPGSSGSALFDSNKRLVGQLHGGPSVCGGSSLYDQYGMFHLSWDGGGTATTRLKDWLDPSNTNATTMDGTASCSIVATLSPASSQLFCSTDPPIVLTATTIAGATYQWKRNGVNVGTSSPTYSASSIGLYEVVITTATCATTLSVSLVTPNLTPVIVSTGGLKYCTNVPANSNPILRLSQAYSSATYQWKWNGYNLPSATADTLLITTAGNYSVVVSKCGAAFTSPAITVSAPPKSPVSAIINKTVCPFTTTPTPNYSMENMDLCGSGAVVNANYTSPMVGYDNGIISGVNPSVTIVNAGPTTSIKIKIVWQKKAGGTSSSCGTAHVAGGDPFNEEVSFRVQAPNGTIVPLMLSSTYTSTTFGGTVTTYFTDSSSTLVSGYPVSGTFKPFSPLSALNSSSANGVWTLLPNDNGSGDPLCVSGFEVIIYSENKFKWYAQNNFSNLIHTGKIYTPISFNEGLNTYYTSTECSVFCPSDLTPANLTVDCNCANSSSLSVIGDIGLTKQTQTTIETLSPNTISTMNKVNYKAGNAVILNPGFTASPVANGVFSATIEGCN